MLSFVTLEERLALLEKGAEAKEKRKLEEERKLKEDTQNAFMRVQELAPRIQALIALGNKCIETGIGLPESTVTTKFGYGDGYDSYNFISDGFYHHVGFMDCKITCGWGRKNYKPYKEIVYLGIKEGGACGVWDFYTNGTEAFLKHQQTKEVKSAELRYLNSFLRDFFVFEKAFYAWVDSFTATTEEPVSNVPDIHYYELCFHHDEDDSIAGALRCSYCIKTEIPPAILDEVALQILFGAHPTKQEQELMKHLTCVMELTEDEALHWFDMDALTVRNACEFGVYYTRENM